MRERDKESKEPEEFQSYELAGAVWYNDELMMKPLVFAFPEDEPVSDCKDQYLFGDRLMVCPVTTPMYRENSIPKCTDEMKLLDNECMEYRVFEGNDAEFFLYEDAGDGYGYERGEYVITKISWNEAKKELLTEKI